MYSLEEDRGGPEIFEGSRWQVLVAGLNETDLLIGVSK